MRCVQPDCSPRAVLDTLHTAAAMHTGEGNRSMQPVAEQQRKILVVDDTAPMRYAIVRVLQAAGFQVLEAERGAQALELAHSQQPDLVVLDVKLPDILGFEVTERLKSDPATAQIAVLQVSAAFTDADAHSLGLQHGADGYLVQPVEPQVLIATIQALLRMRDAERRASELLLRERAALQEQQRLAAALQASERHARRLVESGITGVVYWRTDGAITDANDSFLAMLGYQRGDLQAGLDWRTLTPSGWRQEDGRILQTLREGGTALWEKQFVHKNGGRVDVLVGAALFAPDDPNGVAMVLDVTERKRVELERNKLTRELEEALRGRDEFLSIASHDLRTPLAALRLKVQILHRRARQRSHAIEPREWELALADLDIQSARLANLLDSLLDISSISAGKVPLTLDRIDMAAVVRETAQRHAPEVQAAGAALSLELPEHLFGRSDETRLDQVVSNLLSNAIKYGKGRPVYVSLHESDGDAVLTVRDEGPGIPADALERIFQRFERLSGAERRTGSYGLGLWIVQRIVDALEGRIGVASQPQQGTTFTIRLPTAGPAEAA
jgi:PAS domain S-box-containing protein